jgi:ABC-type transporter Mla subunit MlaD
MPLRVLTGLTVAATVLVLAGCGGDDSSAGEDYANSVCGELSEWVTSVDDAARSIQDAGLSVTTDTLQAAVSDVSDATTELVDDLGAIGAPETDDGNEAKSALDSLGTELQQQVDTVEQALNEGGGLAAQLSAITTAIAAAAADVESTFNQLRELDPAGELREGFENAEDCDSLSEQASNFGS